MARVGFAQSNLARRPQCGVKVTRLFLPLHENDLNGYHEVESQYKNEIKPKLIRPHSTTGAIIPTRSCGQESDNMGEKEHVLADDNCRKLVRNGANSAVARHWAIPIRKSGINCVSHVFLDTKLKVSVVQRLKQESQSRRHKNLSPAQKEYLKRVRSADPEMMRMRRLASMRNMENVTTTDTPIDRRRVVRKRFQRAVTLLMSVLRCMKIIVTISDSLTTRTAIELQWHTLNTSTEARKLAFNPSVYAKCRVYAKMPKWAKKILAKEPSDRSDADCRRLHALLRGLRSFDKFTEQIQLAMCRSFTYYNVTDTRVILRKGHVGQHFYFIYSGSVFVNVEDRNGQGEKFVKTEVVFSKGDSFGELALLRDITRTATITCRESCELLGVDKEVFSQVCPRIFDKELDEKVAFVSRLPLFHSKYWSPEALQNLCFDSQIQEYKTNKVVVADSTKEDWMYICMEGQCRIIKCLALEESISERDDHQGALLQEEDLLTAEFLDSMHRRRSSIRERRASRSSRSTISMEQAARHKKQMLNSLGLEYVNDQGKQQRDMLSKNSEEKRVEEHRKRAQQGIITLTTLIRQKMEEVKDTVFLDIGTLHAGEVFDLVEILKPGRGETQSCLALISSGSRILRIMKDRFRNCLSSEASEHAKHIAVKNMYPSNKVLMKSYREKTRWDKYKQTVLDEVLGPFEHHPKRRDVVERAKASSAVQSKTKSLDARLMSTLRHQGNDRHMSLEPQQKDPFAVDEDALIDHDDFESRLLRELDGKLTENLKIKSINPVAFARRSSFSVPMADPLRESLSISTSTLSDSSTES